MHFDPMDLAQDRVESASTDPRVDLLTEKGTTAGFSFKIELLRPQ